MTDRESDIPAFSKWRAYLWPVYAYELKKLLPMLGIFFLISFDYNILRTMKDSVVVTAESSGAEVIPFIKVWGMFPAAVLMTFVFSHLSNRLSFEKVVYVMLSGFLLFFLLFALFFYPHREALHFDKTANWMESVLPSGFKWWIAIYRNWTLTSFYIMAELWSNIVLSMLIWGFANQVTKIGEAKRFYALFGIGANLSGVAAGLASGALTQKVFNETLPFGKDAWEQTIVILVALVLVVGIAAMAIFRWFNKTVMTDPRFAVETDTPKEEKKQKPRYSLRECISFLLRSRYLLCLGVVVVSYNIVINLVEVLWKHEVKELYPNPLDFNLYMSQVMTWIGVLATFSALFISGNAIRLLGWTFTALLTPAILLLTSVGFFTFFFLKDNPSHMLISLLGNSPLVMVVLFGSLQNILCRGAKYSVFDATKEIAFVPLDQESKIKGKAAIDGICSRLGKSGGSLIHQSLLMTLSSLTASAPYVGGILFTLVLGWIGAVNVLGRMFNAKTSFQKSPEKELTSSALIENERASESELQEKQAY